MYELIWRNRNLAVDVVSIDDMIKKLTRAVKTLTAMRRDGVTLADGAEDDYACLVTTDAKVARKYGFEKQPEADADFDELPRRSTSGQKSGERANQSRRKPRGSH